MAEQILIGLLRDPELQSLQCDLKAELANCAIGRDHSGAATLDDAVAQWTNSMIFTELSAYQAAPAFLWTTDNSPRNWFGYELGGAGIAGDNPDFIYRRLTIEGAGRYEITGRIDLEQRPSEMTIEVMRGNVGPSVALKNQNKNHADMGNQVSVMNDRVLTLGADGSFRITVGSDRGEGNHLITEPGEMTILIRDVLADWNQRPASVSVRRIRAAGYLNDPADLKQRVLTKLPDYVRFWANYPVTWLGGLQPNSYTGPVPRDGGWGYIAGARFALQSDEALLMTTTSGNAGYTGFQVTGPWMISPNRLRYQSSLNVSQAVPNADGSYTYLVCSSDPGIANWIDNAGHQSGFALLRWQAVPAGTNKDDLIREFRIIKLSEAWGLTGVPRITAEQRQAALATQRAQYGARVAE